MKNEYFIGMIILRLIIKLLNVRFLVVNNQTRNEKKEKNKCHKDPYHLKKVFFWPIKKVIENIC